MEYQLVFDAATAGYEGWFFVVLGAVFVVIGAVSVFSTFNAAGADNTPQRRLIAWSFLLFAVAWTGAAGWLSLSDFFGARTASAENTCTTVAGVVSGLTTERRRRGFTEAFTVDGVQFSFADNVLNGGFHRTSGRGGPIRDGAAVRICYVPTERSGNVIARLEVAS